MTTTVSTPGTTTITMSVNDAIIWCAGFFEAAGRIQVVRPSQSSTRSLVITINKQSQWTLNRFRENVGGGSVMPIRGTGRQTLWRWQSTGFVAGEFLQRMLPWIVTKREQVLLAIELANTVDPSRRKVSDEILVRREEIENELRAIRNESRYR
jgi:hypothetical protein